MPHNQNNGAHLQHPRPHPHPHSQQSYELHQAQQQHPHQHQRSSSYSSPYPPPLPSPQYPHHHQQQPQQQQSHSYAFQYPSPSQQPSYPSQPHPQHTQQQYSSQTVAQSHPSGQSYYSPYQPVQPHSQYYDQQHQPRQHQQISNPPVPPTRPQSAFHPPHAHVHPSHPQQQISPSPSLATPSEHKHHQQPQAPAVRSNALAITSLLNSDPSPEPIPPSSLRRSPSPPPRNRTSSVVLPPIHASLPLPPSPQQQHQKFFTRRPSTSDSAFYHPQQQTSVPAAPPRSEQTSAFSPYTASHHQQGGFHYSAQTFVPPPPPQTRTPPPPPPPPSHDLSLPTPYRLHPPSGAAASAVVNGQPLALAPVSISPPPTRVMTPPVPIPARVMTPPIPPMRMMTPPNPSQTGIRTPPVPPTASVFSSSTRPVTPTPTSESRGGALDRILNVEPIQSTSVSPILTNPGISAAHDQSMPVTPRGPLKKGFKPATKVTPALSTSPSTEEVLEPFTHSTTSPQPPIEPQPSLYPAHYQIAEKTGGVIYAPSPVPPPSSTYHPQPPSRSVTPIQQISVVPPLRAPTPTGIAAPVPRRSSVTAYQYLPPQPSLTPPPTMVRRESLSYPYPLSSQTPPPQMPQPQRRQSAMAYFVVEDQPEYQKRLSQEEDLEGEGGDTTETDEEGSVNALRRASVVTTTSQGQASSKSHGQQKRPKQVKRGIKRIKKETKKTMDGEETEEEPMDLDERRKFELALTSSSTSSGLGTSPATTLNTSTILPTTRPPSQASSVSSKQTSPQPQSQRPLTQRPASEIGSDMDGEFDVDIEDDILPPTMSVPSSAAVSRPPHSAPATFFHSASSTIPPLSTQSTVHSPSPSSVHSASRATVMKNEEKKGAIKRASPIPDGEGSAKKAKVASLARRNSKAKINRRNSRRASEEDEEMLDLEDDEKVHNRKKTGNATKRRESMEPEYDQDGEQLYCVCRTPYDGSKFMIGCDRCQEWFHGECIGVSELDAELVDEYFCPTCCAREEGLKSSWKQKCARNGCRRPAAASATEKSKLKEERDGDEPFETNTNLPQRKSSKYCSSECGMTVARTHLERLSSTRKRALLGRHLSTTKDTDAGNQGASNDPARCERHRNRLVSVADMDDRLRLLQLREQRSKVKKHLEVIELRGKIVSEAIEHATSLSGPEVFIPSASKKKGGSAAAAAAAAAANIPDVMCAFDYRLVLDDATLEKAAADKKSKENGIEYVLTENLGDRALCEASKRKCTKHNQWQRLKNAEVEQERSIQTQLLAKLDKEEKQIKARMRRRRSDLAAALLNGTIKHGKESASGKDVGQIKVEDRMKDE